MDLRTYRSIHQRVVFTAAGFVPAAGPPLHPLEMDGVLGRLDRTWEMVASVAADARVRDGSPSEPTETEKRAAMKRWLLSHHVFITNFGVITDCLDRAVTYLQQPCIRKAREWVNLAARLRRGCGALFLYAVDFAPCAAIYSDGIRSGMPPAFSGFWIRERQRCLQPALVRFNAALSGTEELRTPCSELQQLWKLADQRYHQRHEESMRSAVGDGKSLARIYREQTGKSHAISEEEFHQLDKWFCIERQTDLTRLDYIFQSCDLVERLMSDVLTGHRLCELVLAELLDGARALLAVFGHWLGPVPETSSYYPRCLRGE